MEVRWMCWCKRKITFFKEVTKHSLKGAIITQNEFLLLFSRMFPKLQRNRCSWLLLPTKRTVLDWSQLKAIPLALKKSREINGKERIKARACSQHTAWLWLGGGWGGGGLRHQHFQPAAPHGIYQLPPYCLHAITPLPLHEQQVSIDHSDR